MELNLFVADKFDTLASGKTLAYGLFPDRVVVIPVPGTNPGPTAEQPFGLPLSLLINLSGFASASDKTLAGRVEVLPPNDQQPIAGFDFKLVPDPTHFSANMISAFDPLLIPAEGKYQVVVQVGEARLVDTFEVRLQRMEKLKAAAPAPEKPKARAVRRVINKLA